MLTNAPRSRFRRAVPFIAALWIACALPSRAVATREERSTHPVITYFIGGEWHIFDPVTRRDTLFLPVSTASVYWDPAESTAEYLSGDQLFRVRWELEAQPWPVLQLPGYDFLDWWFNPKSRCWQAMKVRAVWHAQSALERPQHRCRTELWQSDRQGGSWRLASADTVACEDSNTYPGGWGVPDPPGVHRSDWIGIGRLQDAMTVDAWGGTPERVAPPRGELPTGSHWVYIPCRSILGRGVVYRVWQRPNGPKSFMSPFYLVDRTRGTQQLLETPTMHRDQDDWRMGMEEHDGFLLISGIRTFVFDLRTGAQILSQPNAEVRRAVWIQPPAAASVDSVGQRRLRERFR